MLPSTALPDRAQTGAGGIEGGSLRKSEGGFEPSGGSNPDCPASRMVLRTLRDRERPRLPSAGGGAPTRRGRRAALIAVGLALLDFAQAPGGHVKNRSADGNVPSVTPSGGSADQRWLAMKDRTRPAIRSPAMSSA